MSITTEERAALLRLEADQYEHIGDRVCDLAICATIALREHAAEQPSPPITPPVKYVGAAARDGVLHLFDSDDQFRHFTNGRRVSWMGWLSDVVFHHQTKASE